MASPILSDEELNQLEDGLPVLIDDPGEILRAMKQAGMQRGILKVPADVPQMWHQAVRYAAVHGRLPLLLIRVLAQLVGRTDADSVLQLISVAIERNVSVVLTEEVRKIQYQADQLLGE